MSLLLTELTGTERQQLGSNLRVANAKWDSIFSADFLSVTGAHCCEQQGNPKP